MDKKEVRIVVPEGYEIDEENSTFGYCFYRGSLLI